MKICCEICQDLLPSYIDDLLHEKSKQCVKEHLENCEHCQAILKTMNSEKQNVSYDVQSSRKPFKLLSRQIWKRAVSSILCFFVLFGLVYTLMCEIAGEGMSFTAWRCRIQAIQVIQAIENSNYEAAAKNIGFLNLERKSSEQRWISSVRMLFEEELNLEELSLISMQADDGLVKGRCIMEVYDPVFTQWFTVELQLINQDDRIAFGYPQIFMDDSEAAKSVEERINKALSTYNPG